MNCREVRSLLSAHLDEELDVVNDAAVADHLEHCPECAAEALALAGQRTLLQEKLTRHRAPEDFVAQIRAELREAAPTAPARPRPLWVWLVGRPAMVAVASAVVALGVGFFLGERQMKEKSLVNELTAAHVRARLTDHVIDVASSDRHTVKPWFIGRVDFAPFVPDLATDGFPLLGGRLERLSGRMVATLVYGRRKHSIDVHVWSGLPGVPRALSQSGYSIRGWTAGDLNFTAVSDVAPDDLAELEQLFQAKLK